MNEVEAVAGPNERVVLVCNMGGNLDPDVLPQQVRHAEQARKGLLLSRFSPHSQRPCTEH